MGEIKQYDSLDEVRAGIHEECDCAIDEAIREIVNGHPQADFTVYISRQLAKQIRSLSR